MDTNTVTDVGTTPEMGTMTRCSFSTQAERELQVRALEHTQMQLLTQIQSEVQKQLHIHVINAEAEPENNF